ncbi:MAG: enoyl-CoA hydratase/isomerase family protein, partial [Rubrivivax sp.]
CKAPLPDWVFDGREGVHGADGSWSPTQGKVLPLSALPVYQRQHFRENVVGAAAIDPATAGNTLHEDASMRLWTLDDEVLIASIKTKVHAIDQGVIEGLKRGIALADGGYKGLVIWSGDDPFSYGADLQSMLPEFMKGGAKAIAPAIKLLQDTMLAMRYANVPTVAAVRGMALGGGCEIAVYCAKRVASMESYIGLVEVGVGLIPAGGGLAYVARRAAEMAAAGNANADVFPFIREGFTSAAMAKVGTSAIESRKLGYLLDSDLIVPHKDELLFVAIAQAKAMFDSGYRAPARALFPAAGRSAKATIQGQLANMRDGGFISKHDFHISSLIADVICGGDVDAGSLVNEEYLMALERKHFCALLDNPKTQERIMGMMQTGKPVRN